MFKPNPKRQVELKFVELFGTGHAFHVSGHRFTPLECATHGLPTGTYTTELTVDDHVIARAAHRDWRTAYRLLRVEIESLYGAGTALAQ